MGILRVDENDDYYNSIMTLAGRASSFYDKHHLVPFAEYFPVPAFIRSWLRLMNLPYSDFTPGAGRCSRRSPPAARAWRWASATRMPTAALNLPALAQRRRAGQRHQRCLVRPFLGALPAFPDRPHARHGGAAAAGAGRQRWHLGAGGRARRGAGAGRAIHSPRCCAEPYSRASVYRPMPALGNWPVVVSGPAGRWRSGRRRRDAAIHVGTGTALPGLSLTLFPIVSE